MFKEKFLEIEYQTLRRQIEESDNRIFKILVGGITVVPTAQYVAKSYEIEFLNILLPFFVLVLILLYIAESTAIMRTGIFIKENIEPHAKGVTGWESWLESDKNTYGRLTDKIYCYCLYVIAILYYAASVFLAVRLTVDRYGYLAGQIIFLCYLIMGFGIIFKLFPLAKKATSHK